MTWRLVRLNLGDDSLRGLHLAWKGTPDDTLWKRVSDQSVDPPVQDDVDMTQRRFENLRMGLV